MDKWKKLDDEPSVDLNDLVLNIVDDELAEEGLGKLISFAALALTLGASGIVEGATFRKNMENFARDKVVQQGKLTITKSELGGIIEKSKDKRAGEMIGKYRRDATINIVARTLFAEAKGQGKEGMKLVMTVIWNRTGGDASKFVDAIFKYLQFSCWNKFGQKSPSTYTIKFPKGALDGSSEQTSLWNDAVMFATQAVDGTFVPINKEWNAYYNPAKSNPDWGSKLKKAEMQGNHKVGYLRDQDGWRKGGKKAAKKTMSKPSTGTVAQKPKKPFNRGPTLYDVKDGDTLFSIANRHGMNVAQLKKLNGLSGDTIHKGQTLKLS